MTYEPEKYERTTIMLEQQHFDMLDALKAHYKAQEHRRHISASEIVRRAIELLHKETA